MNRLRDWINQNSSVVTVSSIAILIICLGILFKQFVSPHGPRGPRITSVWYYDLNTKTIFASGSTATPPIVTDSGPLSEDMAEAGVRAYIFSCGECPDDLTGKAAEELESDDAFIGWLEKYSPEAKAEMEKPLKDRDKAVPPVAFEFLMIWEEGHYIQEVGDEQWYLAMSAEGIETMHSLREACTHGKYPKRCYPPNQNQK
ncbi:MAG: hypothetical protein QF785_04470 [Phycisphaeraceae bacterium]|jgi:hypothetical protein|nr:hypothetical protein [Phycisphaeraceae bacterium]